MQVDLVIPVRGASSGKSRLRAGTDVADDAHARLVVALARDTIAAATATPGIGRVLVVTADAAVTGLLDDLPVEVIDDGGARGLNEALRRGDAALCCGRVGGITGALQADLPALRPEELAAAIAEADGRRAFCADRHGSGTTLLLSAAGRPLAPAFGIGSATAHAASGAHRLSTPLPTLRCDVDTIADLAAAAALGLGPHTALAARAYAAS